LRSLKIDKRLRPEQVDGKQTEHDAEALAKGHARQSIKAQRLIVKKAPVALSQKWRIAINAARLLVRRMIFR
jgi:hypothetical protein